jgi:PAS domain S-box-containing protein
MPHSPKSLLEQLTPTKIHRGFVGYFVASWLFCVALLARLVLAPLDAGIPFLTFFPAITLAVFFGGAGPGLLTSLLSSIAVSYLFIQPVNSFTWHLNYFLVWTNAVFWIETLLIIFIIEAFFKQAKQFKQINHHLRHKQIQFEFLCNNQLGFASFMLDSAGRVNTWNPGAQKLLGFTEDEVLGLSSNLFYTQPDIEKQLPSQILELARIQGIHEKSGWLLRKDGSRLFANVLILPYPDTQGRFAGYIKILRDITSQHQYGLRLEQIIQSAPIPLLMVNAQSEIIMLNPQTAKLFGYTAAELLGSPLEILIPQRFRLKHRQFVANYVPTQETRSMAIGRDLFALHKNGHEFPIEIGLCSFQTGGEQLALASLTDITQRKTVEKLLMDAKLSSEQINLNCLLPIQEPNLTEQVSSAQLAVDLMKPEQPIITESQAPTTPETRAQLLVTTTSDLAHLVANFDIPTTLARLYGNEALLRKLLLSFATTYASVADQIDTLMAADKAEKAAELLHRLKGAAAKLGAQALADAAQQFKNEIRSAGALEARNSFGYHLQEAVQAIQQHILPSEPEAEKLQKIEPKQLLSILHALAASLNRHQLPSDAELEQITTQLTNHVPQFLLDEFDQQLLDFDFAQAKRTLHTIEEEFLNHLIE